MLGLGLHVDAAKAGDIVVVSVGLKELAARVPAAPLAGKIVIDTNNYYPQRDGYIPKLDDESTTPAPRRDSLMYRCDRIKLSNRNRVEHRPSGRRPSALDLASTFSQT